MGQTLNIDVPDIGLLKIQRKKGVRNINLRVSADGSIRVSAPWYVPKSAVFDFLLSKKDWIKKHQQSLSHVWRGGQLVTPELQLRIEENSAKRPSRVFKGNELIIFLPNAYTKNAKTSYIERSVTQEQKNYCEQRIVAMLDEISKEHQLTYKSCRVKSLKSRWGSCDQNKNIVLNSHLASLPESLVRYVLIHELAHTQYLNHGKSFWNCVAVLEPNHKKYRKLLRSFHPAPRPYRAQPLMA